MTEITAPNLMLQNTMADIKTSNIQSITSELDQITLRVITEEPHTPEVKGVTTVSDDALTANVLQSLVPDDTSNDAEEVKQKPYLTQSEAEDDVVLGKAKDVIQKPSRKRDVKREKKAWSDEE